MKLSDIEAIRLDDTLYRDGGEMMVPCFPDLKFFIRPRAADRCVDAFRELHRKFREDNGADAARNLPREAERVIDLTVFFDVALVRIEGLTDERGQALASPVAALRAQFFTPQADDVAIKMPNGETIPEGLGQIGDLMEVSWDTLGKLKWAEIIALGKPKSGNGSGSSAQEATPDSKPASKTEEAPPVTRVTAEGMPRAD